MAKKNSTAKLLGVSAVEISDNGKIGKVSATYVSQNSCPDCPLKGSGCYAEHDFTGFTTRRLNAHGLAADELAANEAKAIDGLTGYLPLRLHVVGDCSNNERAAVVSKSADKYRARHNNPVWAYTHAWREVLRSSWGKVSILASCENFKDAKKASAKGYATAVVVTEHASPKAYKVDGMNVIPCPQQTGKAANCAACKLCWNADRLFATQSVIAFEVHGGGVKKATNAVLNILQ